MSDLILRTQLEILGKNLKRLQNISDSLEQQRNQRIMSSVKCLSGDESVGSSIEKINVIIRGIIKRYRGLLDDCSRDDKLLDEEEQILLIENQKALKILRIAKGNVEKMKDSSVPLKSAAGRELEKEANNLIEIIEKVRKLIDGASKYDKEGNKEEAENLRRNAWDRYSNQLYKQSQNLFTEYVDFLRGLAMRDTRLDEGICQIVDELISKRQIRDVSHWFSIPDRYEAVSMTLSRIIHIGFPEWTIWAIPLAVHELGHIAVENRLQRFIEEKAQDEKSRQCLCEILCDAFATYVMGPAYACAAILMRFNPTEAYEEKDGHTADAKRAHVILGMLGWMSSGRHYGTLIEDIKKEWEEAMRQAGQPADLKSKDKKQLDTWMIELEGREEIKKIASGYYAVDSHTRANVLEGEFRTKKGMDIEVYNTDDLVIVLNAAWLGRTYYPDKTDDIEDAAWSVWDKIPKIPKRPIGGPPATAAPPGSGG